MITHAAPRLRGRVGRPAGLVPALLLATALWLPAATPAAAGVASPERAAAKLERGFTSAERQTPAARAALAALKVSAPGSMRGYARDRFPHWLDATAWGWPAKPNSRCDVRNAALYRDGSGVRLSANCTNAKGSWLDPYTGRTLTRASQVDIDHLVPLAEAWRSGAAGWPDRTRRRFANDALVVLAVDDGTNQTKGDKDPTGWKPPNRAAHCLYAKRWIAIKTKYALSVDAAEKGTLTAMLDKC